MKRKRLSSKVRLRIFLRSNGVCHVCSGAIQAGQAWDLDHIIPLAMGGADDESNMAPAHRKTCHAGKSRDDARKLAKALRNEARHLGFTAPRRPIRSAPFPKAVRKHPATTPVAKVMPRRALYVERCP